MLSRYGIPVLKYFSSILFCIWDFVSLGVQCSLCMSRKGEHRATAQQKEGANKERDQGRGVSGSGIRGEESQDSS